VQYAVAIGFGSFLLASLVVGVRLIRLSHRTRQLPELLIGVGVLCIGPLGFGLSMIAALPGRSTILGATLVGSSFLGLFIGAASQYVFVWYVFRQHAAWARPLCVAAVLMLAGGYAGDILENGLINRSRGGVWFWLGALLRVGVLGWVAAESLVYYRRMRKRLALGLAEPVVTNRFLLWGLGSGSAFAGSATAAAVIAVMGFSASGFAPLALLLSGLGALSAMAMLLAFLPPRRYRRWIERRSRESAVGVSSDSR
jgi:hypothetical protein